MVKNIWPSYYLSIYNPEILFYVRPYPFDKENIISKFVDKQKNIFNINEMDDFTKDDHFEAKYKQLSNCLAFFHCGTTLGIEAALLNIPTYLVSLDIKSRFNNKQSFSEILKSRGVQSHVSRYMIQPSPSSYLNTTRKLKKVLKNINNSARSKMTLYLKEQFYAQSVNSLCEKINQQIDN